MSRSSYAICSDMSKTYHDIPILAIVEIANIGKLRRFSNDCQFDTSKSAI